MAIIVAMGFIDDVKSLPALVKLLIQIIAAIVAVSFWNYYRFRVHFGFIEDLGLTNIFNIILTNRMDCWSHKCYKFNRWFRWAFQQESQLFRVYHCL